MGRFYWQISILSKWLQWLNMEEDPFVVDAEILDHVSDPLPLPFAHTHSSFRFHCQRVTAIFVKKFI